MPVALLDTNAVSDLLRDHPQLKSKSAAHSGLLAYSIVVLGEIRYGLDRLPLGKKRSDLEARAQTILSALLDQTITPHVAETYGRLKATLETRGLVLQDNDLWIAATTLNLGGVLVTRDQAFKQVPGLTVEDWTA